MKWHKIILFTTAIACCYSCEKYYNCICYTNDSKVIVKDAVKTTRLGSKGFKRTCENYSVKDTLIYNCHLE